MRVTLVLYKLVSCGKYCLGVYQFVIHTCRSTVIKFVYISRDMVDKAMSHLVHHLVKDLPLLAHVRNWGKKYTCQTIPFSFEVLLVAKLGFSKLGEKLIMVSEFGI